MSVELTPPISENTDHYSLPGRITGQLGRVTSAMLLVAGVSFAAYTSEELASPATALAYDAETGDYPWALADHVPQPPATDALTWGYVDKGICDQQSAAYNCSAFKRGDYYIRDQWGNDLRNCTSYVAWRLAVEFGVSASNMGSGKDWNDKAPGKGWTVRPANQTPEVGDIAQWDSGGSGFGHVAFVERVNADGSVYMAEYNRGLNGKFGHRNNMRADHYIDVNGPNPTDFVLKLGATSSAPPSSTPPPPILPAHRPQRRVAYLWSWTGPPILRQGLERLGLE